MIPEGAVDNLVADGWLPPDDAANLESRVVLLRRAAQSALAQLRRARSTGQARDSLLLAIARAEGELGSALNTLDSAGEVR